MAAGSVLEVDGAEQLPSGSADHLPGGEARGGEPLSLGEGEDALGVGGEDDHGRVGEHRPEAEVLLRQLPGNVELGGQIDGGADAQGPPGDLRLLREDLDVEQRAVLAAVLPDPCAAVGRGRTLERGEERRDLLLPPQVRDGHREQLVVRIAVLGDRRRINEEDAQRLRVEGEGRAGDGLEQRFHGFIHRLPAPANTLLLLA